MTEVSDATPLSGNWNYPTTMRFGVGRIKELPQCCRNLGMTRPLLVTDPGLTDRDIVKDAAAANDAVGLPTSVFSDIKPNPVGRNISDGLRAFHEDGHDGSEDDHGTDPRTEVRPRRRPGTPVSRPGWSTARPPHARRAR